VRGFRYGGLDYAQGEAEEACQGSGSAPAQREEDFDALAECHAGAAELGWIETERSGQALDSPGI